MLSNRINVCIVSKNQDVNAVLLKKISVGHLWGGNQGLSWAKDGCSFSHLSIHSSCLEWVGAQEDREGGNSNGQEAVKGMREQDLDW